MLFSAEKLTFLLFLKKNSLEFLLRIHVDHFSKNSSPCSATGATRVGKRKLNYARAVLLPSILFIGFHIKLLYMT